MSAEESSLEHETALEHDEPRLVTPTASGRTRTAHLSILLGPDAGRTYTFENECTIGRSAEATIRVHDRGVSRVHVRVRRLSAERFLVEDLSSRNGTLVDGKRVGSAEVESGAHIQVGPRSLLLFSLHDEFDESLAQAKKMEIIGRLSAGINHDFNNLLCVVLANAAYVLELPRNTTLAHPEVRECLEDMRAAAQAGAELTGRLATLVQGGPAMHETIDLSRMCNDIASVLRDTVPRSVRVEPRIQPGISVRGVRSHLWQLLLNPCLNARDAMPDGGVLMLEAVLKTADELDSEPPVHAECYAVITVADTGRGMPPVVLKAAFEPFFTTKDIDLGRGLGLATVRKVASEHGGTAELTSELGVGTTLQIMLPFAESRSDGPSLSAQHPRSARQRQEFDAPSGELATDVSIRTRPRVLVAENDEALARAFGRALQRAGYEMVRVANAEQALATFTEQSASLHAVLLDFDMPDSSIRNVQTLIRSRNPELPIIVLTTAQTPSDAASNPPPTDESVLRKPVDPAVLTRVLSAAVRRHGGGGKA